MAFQDVNQKATNEPVKLTGLKVGGSVTAFVVSFVPSKQNPDNMNILMQGEDGGTFYCYTSGNVKYLIKDGKIKQGLLTKIERIEDKMVNGKKSSQFRVLQDPERSISTTGVNPPLATAGEEGDSFEAITSTTANRSADEERITKHAKGLAAAMAGGKRSK